MTDYEQPHPQQQTQTILLAEDEPAVRRVICLALERHGFQVLEARCASHAVSLCAEHDGPIHLLLADAQMAEMTGQQLAERIVYLRSGLPVLFISGYSRELLASRRLLADDVNFLQKPFAPGALADKVREVLGP